MKRKDIKKRADTVTYALIDLHSKYRYSEEKFERQVIDTLNTMYDLDEELTSDVLTYFLSNEYSDYHKYDILKAISSKSCKLNNCDWIVDMLEYNVGSSYVKLARLINELLSVYY